MRALLLLTVLATALGAEAGPRRWHPDWGWYFADVIEGVTIPYVATLPEDGSCVAEAYENERLIRCGTVIYRPFSRGSEVLFEIVGIGTTSSDALGGAGGQGGVGGTTGGSSSVRID